jgi:hypothetical protein
MTSIAFVSSESSFDSNKNVRELLDERIGKYGRTTPSLIGKKSCNLKMAF